MASMETLRTLVSILQMIKQLGYNPQKTVTELAQIKSLRQTERRLKNDCKIQASRAARYKEIIPLCEQLLPLGIGFAELSAFHAAILRKWRWKIYPMERLYML
jgi:hypothetical protein